MMAAGGGGGGSTCFVWEESGAFSSAFFPSPEPQENKNMDKLAASVAAKNLEGFIVLEFLIIKNKSLQENGK